MASERRTFPATLDSLAPIREVVRAAAAAAGLADEAAYKLTLAVDEIATNIITHGFAEKGLAGDLAVAWEHDAAVLRIVLEDGSPEFDPRTMSLPSAEDLQRPLENRRTGGLGIFLTVHGVDRFDYQRRDGRNHNLFEMRLPR
jgi:serine/threonine-protein kinase RsbW